MTAPETLRGPDGRVYTLAHSAAQKTGYSLSYIFALRRAGKVRGLRVVADSRVRAYVLLTDVERYTASQRTPKCKAGIRWLSEHPGLTFERIDDFRRAMRRDGLDLSCGQAKSALAQTRRLLPRRGVRLLRWIEAEPARRLLAPSQLRGDAELALGFPVTDGMVHYAVLTFDKRHGKPTRPGDEWLTYEEAQAFMAEHKLTCTEFASTKRMTVLETARRGDVPMQRAGRRLYFHRPSFEAALAARQYGTKELRIRQWLERRPEVVEGKCNLRALVRQMQAELASAEYSTVYKVVRIMRAERAGEACAD